MCNNNTLCPLKWIRKNSKKLVEEQQWRGPSSKMDNSCCMYRALSWFTFNDNSQ